MMTRTRVELDPRARRALLAARSLGLETSTAGAFQEIATTRSRPRSSRPLVRELRGLLRIVRLADVTRRLVLRARAVQAEIVHAHDFDTLPAAYLIARRTNSRLVYDAHELYTGFDRDPPRLWLAVISRLEGFLARRAAAVVTVSDEIADELVRRHSLAQRPYIVLNAPPLEDVELRGHDGPVRAIYQAAAGPGRYLDDLTEVEDVEIHSRVLGDVTAPAHVTQHPPVPPDQLVQALAEFDIGLVIDRPETENARLALPNKLFEYLMAGLAVLVPRAPAMAALVERESVGRVYDPGKLGEALAALAADRPALEEMRRRARQAAVERYNAEAQWPALYAAWGL